MIVLVWLVNGKHIHLVLVHSSIRRVCNVIITLRFEYFFEIAVASDDIQRLYQLLGPT